MPSGLASAGSLLAGLTSANDIVRTKNGTSAAEASASAAATASATQVSYSSPNMFPTSPKVGHEMAEKGAVVVGQSGKVLENMMKRAYDLAIETFLEKLNAKMAALDGVKTGEESIMEQTTTKKTLLALIAGMEGLKGSLIKEV